MEYEIGNRLDRIEYKLDIIINTLTETNTKEQKQEPTDYPFEEQQNDRIKRKPIEQ